MEEKTIGLYMKKHKMKEIDLNEKREIQLGILIQVDKFCREHGLRYSLAYGTLIGAVRHGGYIPWDDDIDIMMPRPDYEKFLTEFEENPPLPYLGVKNYRNDNVTAITWTEVIDKRTVMYATSMLTSVYIDVFPIDGAPEDDRRIDYIEEMLKRRHYMIRKRKSYKYGKNKFKMYAKYIIKNILYPRSREWAIREYEEYVLSYPFETSPNAGRPWSTLVPEALMPTGIFKKYTTIEFEGHNMMCIVEYDTYLKRMYGDYMTPPPENQRVGHNHASYWNDDVK